MEFGLHAGTTLARIWFAETPSSAPLILLDKLGMRSSYDGGDKVAESRCAVVCVQPRFGRAIHE